MNASYFYLWHLLRPRLLSLWLFMMTGFKTKLGWQARLGQAFLWGSIFMATSLPIAHLSLWIANLSALGVVTRFWLLVGMVAVTLGTLGSLVVLVTLPTLFLWGVYQYFKDKRTC